MYAGGVDVGWLLVGLVADWVLDDRVIRSVIIYEMKDSLVYRRF